MKILVLSNLYPPDTLGGYEMGCRQAVDALRARGHDVRVLTSAPRTPVARQPHVGRKLQLVDFFWNNYLISKSDPFTRRLAESDSYQVNAFNVHVLLTELGEFRPDVVYVWMVTGVGGLGLLACLQFLRTPWVWHLMDEVPAVLCTMGGEVVPALAREVERRLLGPVLACSRQLIDDIERHGVSLSGEIEILPNWVAGPLAPVREEFYRGDRPLRVVAAAAHLDRAYDKGMDLVIGAAALLRARGHDRFSIDIYGKINDNYYGDLIKSHALGDFVRLRGGLSQSELIARYRDYDVFAFPARRREPCAFAPLEAAPSGCVPIMARISGNSEWFVHGVHCLKVERSAEGFARALGQVLGGDVALGPIGRRAAAAVRRDFHLDALLPRIERRLADAARQPRDGAGTPAEAYRLARLAERLSWAFIQESFVA